MSCLNCGRIEEHSSDCYPFDSEYESDEFDDYPDQILWDDYDDGYYNPSESDNNSIPF